jgi:hypothetical protein
VAALTQLAVQVAQVFTAHLALLLRQELELAVLGQAVEVAVLLPILAVQVFQAVEAVLLMAVQELAPMAVMAHIRQVEVEQGRKQDTMAVMVALLTLFQVELATLVSVTLIAQQVAVLVI